jgi:threonine/homoserine/homoserine lactone efflux protein
MPSDQVGPFLLFAIAAAGTPGPSNMLLTATGANVGIVRGLPCLFGVAVGMGVMLFLVAFGLGSIVLANPGMLKALNWIGAAFLLWLAWKLATAGSGATAAGERPMGFVGAAAFQWVNPKSWLVCASAASAYLTTASGSPLVQATTLGALFVAAALPCCLIWLAFGATAQRWLRTARARRTFNLTMAALLAGSVILVIL